MSGPITWAALGALLPLIGAAVSLGMLLAKVTRLVQDQLEDRKDFKALRQDIQKALTTLERHSVQIEGILTHQNDREREYLSLLREHFGVGNNRGSPDEAP